MAPPATLKAPKVILIEETQSSEPAEPWKTILLNCDCHTFDDVENLLIRATHCSLSRARALSWEVHNKGSAVVYSGHRERCEAVAMVLGQAGLLTKVVQ